MRKFYITFPIVDAVRPQLTWTHYRTLLIIKNENERNYYINLVILNNLSSRELEKEIKNKAFDRLSYADKEHIEVINDIKQYTTYSKELAMLEKSAKKYLQYKKLLQDLQDAKLLLEDNDSDVVAMASEEVSSLNEQIENTYKELEILLLPKDPNDDKNVLMEIRGAAGGDEANIFAADLFRMYSRYAESKNWKIEVIETSESEFGGFALVSFMIKGEGAYSRLKFESGAHRVQRVPKTEASGRIHTSTATVLVMPELDEIDFEIKPEDLHIDVYRSGGAGGQHVNKTESAVRITHLPTKIVVSCQDGRSQHENKEQAMRVLRAKVAEELRSKQMEEVGAERKLKLGRGERSEKIRTYNYPQNRVTDHRIGFTLQKLDRIIEGDLDEIIEALINEEQKEKLEAEI